MSAMQELDTILADISPSQKERLAYLELRAYFCGLLRRADLEARFGVGSAAATRDLAFYRELAPNNLVYDTANRFYYPSDSFTPLFPFVNERVLSWLLQGFGDGLPGPRKPVACEGPSSLVNPNLATLARLTRAMHAGKAVRVDYLSLQSGPGSRELVPVALADNGQRWHVRAFDRTRQGFRDFVLTRITRVEVLEAPPQEAEGVLADAQWQRIVDLEIVPHPQLRWPQAVEADYAMHEGKLRLKIRAALAGYALRRWQVDCTPHGDLPANEYHLWLANPQTLYGVESARLAPGYAQEGN